MRMKLILAIGLLLWASATLSAQNITCQQLINEAAEWDGVTVSIIGEVVGDILRSGQSEWLNVNDGTNALGVWTDVKDVESFEIVPGSYSVKGTVLEVEGVFNRTCSMHSGETDIHLVNVKVVGGHDEVEHPVDGNRLLCAAILAVIAGALTLTVVSRKGSSRRRKAK